MCLRPGDARSFIAPFLFAPSRSLASRSVEYASALAAITFVIANYQIVPFVRMSFGAVCFRDLPANHRAARSATPYVDAVYYRFKVIRIDAKRDATQVIKFMSAGDRSAQKFIYRAMRLA